MIRLAIFDLDGVLVDIKDIHYQTLNSALKTIDTKYIISYDEHLSKFDGKKTYDKLNILTKERGLPAELHKKIWDIKQSKTIDELKKIDYKQNIIDSLQYLQNNNIKCAIASNSIRETILCVLESTGYNKYIDIILSNEDVDKSKPSPEIYLKTMLKAGIGPTETVIFEDSPVGIKAAELSGAKVIKIESTKDITVEQMKQATSVRDHSIKWINKKLNVVIPMAGMGSRFTEAGYTFPKPLIEVNGKPMIQTVVDNLNIDANFTFIVQEEHYKKFALKYLLDMIVPDCNIITVDGITEGAACTVLLAKKFIDNNNPLLLANSDQFVEWNSNDFYYSCENSQLDGTILTFESLHPKWSYAKISDDGYVVEVAEKKPISNIATVGIYYWNKGKDFVKYAEQMISKNIRVNNEFYVCPVFNQAIDDHKKFKVYNINNMWGLGTPEDLKYFIENYRRI